LQHRLTRAEYSNRVVNTESLPSVHSSHMHAQPVKDILRLMDTREREGKGEMNSDREKNVFQCTSYFYLLHFLTAGKYNSDFSLDGPMWKRKKA